VVLDVSNGTDAVGRIGLSCINMALTDFYDSHSHYKTRIQIILRDSHKDVVTAASHACIWFLYLMGCPGFESSHYI
ncbi:putative glutamate receptor 2.2, partial [Trifolium medium]|nr:putative glutamate receptor 2.2 [Trifolium medium]